MTILPDRSGRVRHPKPSLIEQKVRGRYFVESRIGGGSFGTVYKVVDLESSPRVDGCIRRAMKVINVADPNKSRIPPPNYVNRRLSYAAREVYYHQLVSSHPNIVTLHEWFLIEDREEVCLILDYCAGGDLRSYVTKGRNPFAGDDRRTRKIVLQICDALDFVHTKGIFHKDLKPHNILISQDGWKIFLCDFGLALDKQVDARGGGTIPYMGPELLSKQGFYCPQRAETWTLGITILNILGLCPWDSATVHNTKFCNFMLLDDHLLRSLPISREANNLIRDILRFHPELRLSIPEISARVLQLHSFFRNPRIMSTDGEMREMWSGYQRMFTRLDPIARRRKEVEYLMRLGKSAFNDLSGRLPSPQRQSSPRRVLILDSFQHPPGDIRPQCPSISPPAVVHFGKPVNIRREWWNVDGVSRGGGRY